MLCAVVADPKNFLISPEQRAKKGGPGKEEQRMQGPGVSTVHWKIQRDFMEVGLFAVGLKQ